jgi:hypothetical protein
MNRYSISSTSGQTFNELVNLANNALALFDTALQREFPSLSIKANGVPTGAINGFMYISIYTDM